jgi:repressor LexA
MDHALTDRQRAVLEAIQAFWGRTGVAPSLADLAATLGVSRATVHEHVGLLKKKGHLDHIERAGRTWRPKAAVLPGNLRRVPLVGRVAAGQPILAAENVEGWIAVEDAPEGVDFFALRVRGDSMIEGGILDGDTVIVRHQAIADDGDIVVALVGEEEATVKKLRKDGARVQLVAMNRTYPPIDLPAERVRIQGKVVGLRRRL